MFHVLIGSELRSEESSDYMAFYFVTNEELQTLIGLASKNKLEILIRSRKEDE